MRYCGIDVSAKPGNQQLVTLHERRSGEALELVATFYEPGTVEDVAATVQGFGLEAVAAVDAPSGHRLDLLKAGSPVRDALGLPEGRYERMRVCDALLFRRALPLYPVPAAGQATTVWEQWIHVGFGLFAALEALGLYRPEPPEGAWAAPTGDGAIRFGRLCETYPDAVFCALLGHRPSPERTPWGLQQRIAALKLKGIVDADGGLWHRTLDELDACAAAYSAYALATGAANWVGDPAEGVIVLPGLELQDRYDNLPPPVRHALVPQETAGASPSPAPAAPVASVDEPTDDEDEQDDEAPSGIESEANWPSDRPSVLAGPDGRGLPAFGIGDVGLPPPPPDAVPVDTEPPVAQTPVEPDGEESNRRRKGKRGAVWRR